MRIIGIVTDVNMDGFIPLIESIEITIYDKVKEEVITIYPAAYKRDYPYQLFDCVEYNKMDDSISPINLYTEKDAFTKEEKIAQAKCLAAVVDRFGTVYERSLYGPLSR